MILSRQDVPGTALSSTLSQNDDISRPAGPKTGRFASLSSRPPNLDAWLRHQCLHLVAIPLFVTAAILVALWIAFSTYLVAETSDAALSWAEAEVERLSKLAADGLSARLGAVAQATEMLRQATKRAFDTPFEARESERGRYAYGDDGMYYATEDNGMAAMYYSGIVPIGPEQQQKAAHLSQLDPVLKDVYNSNDLVVQAYVNTYDSLCRLFPYIDVRETLKPNLDLTSFNFYYLADAAHNPDRAVVWTDVYADPAGRGWIASAIAPVYDSDHLEAVVGADIAVDDLVRTLLTQSVPAHGYIVLVSASGTILAMPPAAEADFGFREVTTAESSALIDRDTFKPDYFNLYRTPETAALAETVFGGNAGIASATLDRPLLVGWAPIAATGWKMLVLMPHDAIHARAHDLAADLQNIGLALGTVLAVLVAVMIALLYQRSKEASRRIATPLREINKIVDRMGNGDYQQPPRSLPIAELNETVQQLVAMGQAFGESQARLEAVNQRLTREIKARASAETQADTSWQRLSEALQVLPVGVLLSRADDRVIFVNDAYRQLMWASNEHTVPMGCSFDGLVAAFEARYAPIYYTDGDRNRPLSRSERLAGRERPTHRFGMRLDNGRHIQVIERRTGDGGTVAVYIDETIQREAEEALATARDQAVEAERLKSAFLSLISHELRTPINAVLGMGDLLLNSPLTPQQAAHCRTLQSGAVALDTTIRRILDYIDALQKGPADGPALMAAEELVRTLVAQYADKALSHGVRIDYRIDDAVAPVVGGHAQTMRTALEILLDNAIEYGGGSAVTLSVATAACDDEQQFLAVSVADGGPGVPEQERKRLFEPFYQADGSYTKTHYGTGLGLATARLLVERHGGAMGFTPRSQGSLFWFRLPVRPFQNDAPLSPALSSQVLRSL